MTDERNSFTGESSTGQAVQLWKEREGGPQKKKKNSMKSNYTLREPKGIFLLEGRNSRFPQGPAKRIKGSHCWPTRKKVNQQGQEKKGIITNEKKTRKGLRGKEKKSPRRGSSEGSQKYRKRSLHPWKGEPLLEKPGAAYKGGRGTRGRKEKKNKGGV